MVQDQIRNRIRNLLCTKSETFPEVFPYLTGAVVLVTGAGGTVGSELCRQIAASRPKQLVLLDICEAGVYDLSFDLKEAFSGVPFSVRIGSVRDIARLNEIFLEFHPSVVFHAAAHKHVPFMEENPGEAVKNNVAGTWNVLSASDQFGVSRFILISTDKAVYPSSVMGATKLLCEQMVSYYKAQGRMRCSSVRFGNVFASSGSVVPLFQRQIDRGGPVTVTHPEMKRYFISIYEAVRLVLAAGEMAGQKDIFLLDMGEPVPILCLAEELIRAAGKEPYTEIPIQFVGVRPGDKLQEALVLPEELLTETPYPGVKGVETTENNFSLSVLEQLFSHPNSGKSLEFLKNMICFN